MERISKIPPQDINAEAAVLSAMMQDKEAIENVAETLQDKHFYRTAHQKIFKAIMQLFRNNIEVDMITVIDQLTTNKDMESAGGKEYIVEISDVVHSGANVMYHAQIVLNKAKLRQIIIGCENVSKYAYEGNTAIDDITNELSNVIDMVQSDVLDHSKDIEDVVSSRIAHYEKAKKEGCDTSITFRTGLKAFDRFMTIKKGRVYVIGARPGTGKTSLVLQWAEYFKRQGHTTCFASLEMTEEDLTDRLISNMTGIKGEKLDKPYMLTDEEISKITEIAPLIKNIHILDHKAQSFNNLTTMAKKAKRLGKCDALIIDYLQLFENFKDNDNVNASMEKITKYLKTLAKELDCPIIVLSQFIKDNESLKNGGRPHAGMIRGSGAIEQNCDALLLMWNPFRYLGNKVWKGRSYNEGQIVIIYSKHRHGKALHDKYVRFIPETTRFKDYE